MSDKVYPVTKDMGEGKNHPDADKDVISIRLVDSFINRAIN